MKLNGKRTRSATLLLVLLLTAAVVLAGCGGTTPRSESSDPQAQQLAQQLNQALAAAGLPAQPAEIATVLYGVDGGVSCLNVGNREHVAGLSGFGSNAIGRRGVMDPKVLAYDAAVITTYCPDKLATFQDLTQSLMTAATVP